MNERVLIVDDAMFMRKLLGNMVKQAGYQVVAEAGNGREALHQYSKHNPDLVLMDITMPEIDGIEGVRLIKAKYPEAKIIMCSAMGQQPLICEALKAGAKGFLVKPVKEERLLEELSKVSGIAS